jgi:hypothetical protein
VLLACWAAFEVRVPSLDTATVHLVGLRDASPVARVSSPVAQLAPDGFCVRTSTGRLYNLVGPPGLSFDGVVHWRRWLDYWTAEVMSDVTRALTRLQAAQASNFQVSANWQSLGSFCQMGAEMALPVLAGPEDHRVH